jgi:hypothetical protein
VPEDAPETRQHGSALRPAAKRPQRAARILQGRENADQRTARTSSRAIS